LRALRFHSDHDLRVEEVSEPPAPRAGEVVVRVVTCGICGTDLHEYMAGPIVTPVEPHPLNGAQNPQILGHEFAGDVVATGPGVTRVVEGDRVAIMPLAYCGKCAYCLRGLQHLCATMACVGLSHAWGGMAELATVAEYQVVPLPESVDYAQGALIEPTAVAAYGVERAGVASGDRVLVTGAGPIGALAALCAHAAGASTVYLSEPNPARRARAEALGVATVLDPTSVDMPELIREQTDGLGVDVAIECSGNQHGFTSAKRPSTPTSGRSMI
jgi:(R,R)-butanediol dehydrogenase/meso-butanediol dehydrogenase/diacetyl reductase